MDKNYDVITFILKCFFYERLEYPFLLTSSNFQPCLLKKYWKSLKNLKQFEIICYNAIYICISWYRKFADFWWRKCWYHQYSRSVSCDLYIFLDLLRKGITMSNFIIAAYVWQIYGRRLFCCPKKDHPK